MNTDILRVLRLRQAWNWNDYAMVKRYLMISDNIKFCGSLEYSTTEALNCQSFFILLT